MTKNLNQATKVQLKDLIIQEAEKEKPETVKQLIALMQERHAVPPKQTANLLIELENEERLYFQKREQVTDSSLKEYILSKQAKWYWTTITLVAATAIAVFAISESDVPLAYLRSALATIFLLFLPGFVLIKALFPTKVPIKTSSENMDMIERIALSLGFSLVLVPMVGLALNYTPWGIRLTPITLSLVALTVVFATAAIFQENQTKQEIIYTTTEQRIEKTSSKLE